MFHTPILFLIFNRVDTTQQVFDAIKQQKPKYLYVAADGPRQNRAGEAEKCKQTRDIIKQIDWDCEVKTLFRDENLGCGKAVSSSITWFFENVEQGIILEDDCLPHPDFFMYCQELLEKYKDNDNIMLIGGDNFQKGKKRGDASYYFSAMPHIWGWASWRTTWDKYDFDLEHLTLEQYKQHLKYYFSNKSIIRYWVHLFKIMKDKRIDTWDYQLFFSIWKNRGLSIIPNVNLISNIGFGEEATHTQKINKRFANLPVKPILPLQHPAIIAQHVKADKYYSYEYRTRTSLFKLIKKTIRKILGINN